MRCPEELAVIVTQIVKHGILQIRAAGWAGDADRAAAIADHIHNLPELLENYSAEALACYWEVERPAFASSMDGGVIAGFEPLWDELGELLRNCRGVTCGTA